MSEDIENLPDQLRDLLAQRELAKADLLLSEAETAKKKAEVLKLKAELLKADSAGLLSVRHVMRW
jgi:hypothetical protein